MIITISGTPGSGKSTVAKIIAKKLNLKHYSTGDLMREMAQERSMSMQEFGEKAKTNPSIDKALDERQINLGKEDNFIIDGRLSYHFIPHSIKVFIDAQPAIRAERIQKDLDEGKRKEEASINIQKSMEERENLEKERFLKTYGINPFDKGNYDIVIDSSSTPADEVAEKVIEGIERKSL